MCTGASSRTLFLFLFVWPWTGLREDLYQESCHLPCTATELDVLLEVIISEDLFLQMLEICLKVHVCSWAEERLRSFRLDWVVMYIFTTCLFKIWLYKRHRVTLGIVYICPKFLLGDSFQMKNLGIMTYFL